MKVIPFLSCSVASLSSLENKIFPQISFVRINKFTLKTGLIVKLPLTGRFRDEMGSVDRSNHSKRSH